MNVLVYENDKCNDFFPLFQVWADEGIAAGMFTVINHRFVLV